MRKVELVIAFVFSALMLGCGPQGQSPADETGWDFDYHQQDVASSFQASGNPSVEAVLSSLGVEASSLIPVRETEAAGIRHTFYTQELNGLPVVAGGVVVHRDIATDAVLSINGQVLDPAAVAQSASLESTFALQVAGSALPADAVDLVHEPQLVYVVDANEGGWLAWTDVAHYVDRAGVLQLDRIFADATSGELVARHPLIHEAKNRTVYTANNTDNFLSAQFMFGEGGSSSDPIAQQAYDGSGLVYDYYMQVHGRDSFDASGAELTNVVHVGTNGSPLQNNAAWVGDLLGFSVNQMIYGDGDGTNFAPFVQSLDVMGHELTHAVSQYAAGLVYQDEPGAINESFSDVMGAAVEAWADGGVSKDTWLIGEDVFLVGEALRYMNDPAADDPIIPDSNPALISSRDFYSDRYLGSEDNGGVHINSGIGNLAFYLLVEGGEHPRGKSPVVVPAIGMEKATTIYYNALANGYITASTDFEGLRGAVAQSAEQSYGGNEAMAAHLAFNAVGVPGAENLVLFYADPNLGYAPLDVTFHDQSTGATSWSWEFGDGDTDSSGPEVTHHYEAPGVYTSKLTINGSNTSLPVEVRVVQAPGVNFSADKRKGGTPLDVQFTNESDAGVTDFQWDFGDGETSTEENPSHTYEEKGAYTVTLTVMGEAGPISREKTDYIEVGVKSPLGCQCTFSGNDRKIPAAAFMFALLGLGLIVVRRRSLGGRRARSVP